MNWAALAPFVVQYGMEAGIQIFQWWSAGKVVEPADWDQLRALVNKSKEEYLAESRKRLGIPDSASGDG